MTGYPSAAGPLASDLINLIVHEEVFLSLRVQNPALVGVSSALIRRNGDDGGQGVFVVAVVDVTAVVLLIGTAVDEALGIMDITIVTVTADADRLGCILEVEEDETSGATLVPGARSHGAGVATFLVYNDIVAGTLGQVLEVAVDVLLTIE